MNLILEHVALSVANLERSLAFYQGLIGMKLVERIECPAGSRLGDLVGLPGAAARIAKLQLGRLTLELFEYTTLRGAKRSPTATQADQGFTHLGFRSRDVHADYHRLKSRGVRFCSGPIEYRPTVWNAYFYGPDGETCELRQRVVISRSPRARGPGKVRHHR